MAAQGPQREWVVPREPQVETSSLLGSSLESHFCLLRQITKASPNQGKGTYLLTHLFFIEMKSQILVSVVQYNDLIRCIYCKMITLSLVNSHYHIVTIFFLMIALRSTSLATFKIHIQYSVVTKGKAFRLPSSIGGGTKDLQLFVIYHINCILSG